MISTHSRSSQPRPAWLATARPRPARQGFSLIEVAIALVIFVIGALAIIRIFPGALSVIGNNGDQQVAANLNRSTMVGLQSEQVTATPQPGITPSPVGVAAKTNFNALPLATFNNSNADGSLNILSWTTNPSLNHSADFKDTNSSVIGIPRFNETLPDTQGIETGDSLSSLSRYRAIVGEKARIIDLKTYGSIAAAQYALTQFPISVQLQGNPARLLPIKPVVSQEFVLNDVRVRPDGTLDFSLGRFDNSDDTTVALDATAGSMLYVSYRYYNGAGNIWGVREEAIATGPVNLNLRTTAFKVKPPTSTARPDAARTTSGTIVDAIVPEIVEVKWRNYLGQGEFGDPTAPNDDLKKIADARRGLVRLPASGATFSSLYKPVILDYSADWSFLLKDGVPSTPANAVYPAFPPSPPAPPADQLAYRQIDLGAPFIEDQAEASLYSLLIESGDAYLSGYGTVDSEPLAENRMVRATNPNNPDQREDELRAGKVTFIVNQETPSRARVAYQTRDRWVQQLAIAASSYKPYGTDNPEPWRDYGLGNDGYLYFHAGEAGKTISISYTLQDTQIRNFVERPFVIETQLVAAAGNVPAGFLKGFYGKPGDAAQVARVRLTNAAGGELAPANLISIQAVRGTSVTARTAYVNGTKYAQKLDTTTRGANP